MNEDAAMIGPPPPEALPKVRADALERAATAWMIRVRGGTWDDAARVSGYANSSNAMRSVRSVFGSLPPLDKDEARRLWRDRLETLWAQALTDAEDRQTGAVTAAVRVAEAASRLDGLAEPQRLSMTPADGELQRWVQTALQASGVVAFPEEGDIFEAELIGE